MKRANVAAALTNEQPRLVGAGVAKGLESFGGAIPQARPPVQDLCDIMIQMLWLWKPSQAGKGFPDGRASEQVGSLAVRRR